MDVAGYSGLRAIPVKKCGCNGILKIVVASKSNKSPIVRVIIRKIQADSSEFSIPVIGLVFDKNIFKSLEDCLEWTLVHSLDPVILKEWAKHKPHTFRESGDGDVWKADFKFYLDGDPGDKWLKEAKRPVMVAFHIGGGTATKFLIGILQSSGQEDFMRWARSFSDREILPLAAGKHPILFGGVLEDFIGALELMNPEDARIALLTRSRVLGDLFAFAESYPLVKPAVQVRHEKERQRLLVKHLLDGEPTYTNMIERDLIRQDLRDSNYDRHKLKKYVRDNPEMATDVLIEETEDRESGIGLGTNKSKEVWHDFFTICDQLGLKKVLDRAAEWLYAITRSRRRRELDEIYADSVGMACMSGTLGVLLWDDVSNRVKRRIYRKYIKRYLE